MAQKFKLPKNESIVESDYAGGANTPSHIITRNLITGKYQIYKVEEDMSLTLKAKSHIPVFDYKQWKQG